ncbi:hypothetical protein [Pseudonocardia acidicola]|uniref:Small secreted domain DUF320 n=1 Tax=Pseudonocardia acidicola TaxID=2724939 RepID=A0ABX1S7X9_9PSEU|nr:hypothetical protein [Pseudonocardia acidicola]NMH96268.1 hypothetical protein [Pseudonocardia acidicola]
MSTTARRVAAVSAMTVPLAFVATGLANAGESHGHGGHCSGPVAAQGGGLVGLDAGVSPALNLGGVLNGGPVSQQAVQVDQSNSGVQQEGGCGGAEAFQAAHLVDGVLKVNPALNVGGIGNGGPVSQSAVQVDRSNSGVQQLGGGHGHGGFASQERGLLGLGLEVSPSINLGGILSGGPVAQSGVQSDAGNSGIVQR